MPQPSHSDKNGLSLKNGPIYHINFKNTVEITCENIFNGQIPIITYFTIPL